MNEKFNWLQSIVFWWYTSQHLGIYIKKTSLFILYSFFLFPSLYSSSILTFPPLFFMFSFCLFPLFLLVQEAPFLNSYNRLKVCLIVCSMQILPAADNSMLLMDLNIYERHSFRINKTFHACPSIDFASSTNALCLQRQNQDRHSYILTHSLLWIKQTQRDQIKIDFDSLHTHAKMK